MLNFLMVNIILKLKMVVANVRYLINNPKIIFADEPTGNLDSANSESIHKLLFELRDKLNKTIL